MLQQTQVATVITYFNRFMTRFPDLASLASATEEEVLGLWSGLGYYARARNLHRAAQICLSQHDGLLPTEPEDLVRLPGVGRSTANAIIAQAHDRRAVILDGNVKRVLSRHRLIEGWSGQSSVEQALWHAADQLTPNQSAANYTQAIMDLGATVCVRNRPQCQACPVGLDCLARLNNRVNDLPAPKPKVIKKEIGMSLVVAINPNNEVLLEKRPSKGIWGGLWSFPEKEMVSHLVSAESADPQLDPIAPIEHLLTHRILKLNFNYLRLTSHHDLGESQENLAWHDLQSALKLGLPKPIWEAISGLVKSTPDEGRK